jgi:peroxiredoxin
LADYRKHYEKIRAAGASVVAVSVDPPERADSMRRELHLPFTILCDTDRRVVRDWDIYNSRERGGIAKPSVFLIDRDRSVRYVSVDGIATRVPASEIIRLLQSVVEAPTARRKLYIPTPTDMFRAVRSSLRRAGRRPPS